jgi:hypothetical protein
MLLIYGKRAVGERELNMLNGLTVRMKGKVSSKYQVPNSREAPKIKDQASKQYVAALALIADWEKRLQTIFPCVSAPLDSPVVPVFELH